MEEKGFIIGRRRGITENLKFEILWSGLSDWPAALVFFGKKKKQKKFGGFFEEIAMLEGSYISQKSTWQTQMGHKY